MPVYAGVETSAGMKTCKFFAKTVILESVSAYIILVCCKKSRTPWGWRRKTPKRVRVKKNWLSYKKVSIDCWLIESEVLSLVPTTANFDNHLSLRDTYHVVGTVHYLIYRPPLRFQTTASRCDFGQKNYYQCLLVESAVLFGLLMFAT